MSNDIVTTVHSQDDRTATADTGLAIRGLTKIYPGPVTALAGLDLDIRPGMFGLLGPNGAGKTTLMRIISGLLEPTAGTVHLDGEDIVAAPQQVWRRLGYLPQELGFYEGLSGRAMLLHLLRLKGVQPAAGNLRDYAAELLDRVGLAEAAERKVDAYSGGMRRRLGIAQAIAGDPRLIVVDEPTAGLDPEERLRFYRLLSELATERIVLLSTHIVEDVAVLCPRFAVIRRGRLLADTAPAAARGELAGTIFEATVPAGEIGEVASRHRVTQAVMVAGEHRVRIHRPEGGAPEGFTAAVPTLEDAYMLLMQRAAGDNDAAGGSAIDDGERATESESRLAAGGAR